MGISPALGREDCSTGLCDVYLRLTTSQRWSLILFAGCCKVNLKQILLCVSSVGQNTECMNVGSPVQHINVLSWSYRSISLSWRWHMFAQGIMGLNVSFLHQNGAGALLRNLPASLRNPDNGITHCSIVSTKRKKKKKEFESFENHFFFKHSQ